MARRPTLDFLKTESGAGVILALAAGAAIILANSSSSAWYFAFVGAPVPLRLGAFSQTLNVENWVGDGLMSVFFLVVGMEIKFEVLRGELSTPRRLAMPLMAALGGMLAPAGVYLLINQGARGSPVGWPIPTATDIAFALAGLAVFARRLPGSLRLFLLTLAIADDLGAVGLIGVLFTRHLDIDALVEAGITIALLAALSRWRRAPFLLYAVGFLAVWGFTLRSGINTSLAGIACALTVPIGARRADQESVLKSFQDALHPYVAYIILPLFAFTASGFSVRGMTAAQILAPTPLGVALGLLIGKPLGVFSFSWAATALRIGRRPAGVAWLDILGVALLCGAGFTLSLYMGGLAFAPRNAIVHAEIRLAVVLASLASVLAGGALLAWTGARRSRADLEGLG
jgi:NhaA family Na+:H+ antiporter